MAIFSDTRLLIASLLCFCSIGLIIATEGYVSLGLMGNYPVGILAYFYFSQAILAFIYIGLTQNWVSKNPQSKTYLHYIIAAALTITGYFLIYMGIPWTIFITCVFLKVIILQTNAVVGNTISFAYDIREFHKVSSRITIAQAVGGIFFGLLLPFCISLFSGITLLPIITVLYLACLFLSAQLKPLHIPTTKKEPQL